MTIDWINFTPWTSLGGGALIGLAVSLFVLANGRIAGISGLLGSVMRFDSEGWSEKAVPKVMLNKSYTNINRSHILAPEKHHRLLNNHFMEDAHCKYLSHWWQAWGRKTVRLANAGACCASFLMTFSDSPKRRLESP